ncbi:cyclin-dependent kinase F-4-like [Henckelia pumila]|uniref:cyclin-dependent kinase F-4-like n=1 Tax=Henckelia pumila TaxID=405737 RepID=UPI003C6E3975
MDRFSIIKELGSGSYGTISKAVCMQSGEVVAIKKLKTRYRSWESCMNLREVKTLRAMNHSSIIKLKEVIMEHGELHFVFEYMECDLFQVMKNRRNVPFSEAEVRMWCFQIFEGLAHMHNRGYFHRDLKPENLLASNDDIKIADLGMAREVDSHPLFTDHVTTRWYRAPEILLGSPIYGPPVDMWAMSAIMAELFILRPLFPGSSGADEIHKISCVIGSPTKSEWPEGLELAKAMNYKLLVSIFATLMPGISEDAIDLITSLCSWNPSKRPTAIETLRHPFFQSCYHVQPSLNYKDALQSSPHPGTWHLAIKDRSIMA